LPDFDLLIIKELLPADDYFRIGVLKMKINFDCMGCGICVDECPRRAIRLVDGKAVINNELCTNCGLCAKVCPVNAIEEDVSQYKPSNRNSRNFSYNPGYVGKRIGIGRGMGIGRRGCKGRRRGVGNNKRRGMGRGLGW